MNNKTSISALILAIIALGSYFSSPVQQSVHKETAYERVTRTMTLRCGYMIVPPFVTIDSNTKVLGGMNYEYIEKMTKTLGLDVTWSEILAGQQVEALRSNKIDAVCGGEAPMIAASSLYLRYSDPIVFAPLNLYVREKDTRFDGRVDDLNKKANSSNIIASVMDGDITLDFAERLFPKAKRHSLSASSEYSQLYADVVAGKADFVICDPFTSNDFMKNNPNKLRQAALDKPLAILPNNISVLRGEEELANLINQGINIMRQRGLENEILNTFDKLNPNNLYRVSLPYIKI